MCVNVISRLSDAELICKRWSSCYVSWSF